MQALLDACFFKKEGEDGCSRTAVDMECLNNFVDRGRARTIDLPDGNISVSVKESSQGDVAGLFCGARSLVVNSASGEIHVRGINKFFDLDELGREWVDDRELWSQCKVYALRKMAGFVVTLFSTDGENLRCMSKHAFEGPHVDMAEKILSHRLSPAQRRAIASDLFALDATASCECIDLTNDFRHPVLEEPAFDRSLVLFAVQQRRRVQECAVPYAEVQRRAVQWGLRAAECAKLAGRDDLQAALAAVQRWGAEYDRFAPHRALAEGFVILAERPLPGGAWVRPLRLKAKTTRYIALRSLRSHIRGDSQPAVLLFHKAVAAWASGAGGAPGRVSLQKMEEEDGVASICRAFAAFVEDRVRQQPRHRHRDSSMTVAEAYEELLRFTEQQVAGAKGDSGSDGEGGAILMLLFCGLPGSGKSTLCSSLLAELGRSGGPGAGHGVLLSRDAVTKAVAERLGITAASSKHKKRRLGHPVHREVQRQLGVVSLFAATAAAPVVLLFDACNATVSTRRTWVEAMPPPPRCVSRVVYVTCSDAAVLGQRIGARPSHELLADPVEAQRALYTLRNKFVPPLPEEEAVVVDTATAPVEESVTELVDLLHSMAPTRGASPRGSPAAGVLTIGEMEEAVGVREDAILYDLLGIDQFRAKASALLAPLTMHSPAAQRADRPRFVALSLDVPVVELRRRVAASIAALLTLPPADGASANPPCPAQLEAQPLSIAGKLAAGLRGVLRPVLALASGRHAPPPAVVSGHTRWLSGWLFRGKAAAAPTEATVLEAMGERFDVLPSAAHVTLLYSSDGETGLGEFWRESGLHVGQQLRVTVRDVFFDRAAVCLSATVHIGGSERTHQWRGTDLSDLPLHVTLGTTDGTPSSYCGGMPARFAEWEISNAALAARRADRTATRSQDKFANFVHLRLPTAMALTGVVGVVQQ